MRARAHQINFGGVFYRNARGRARQVIEQLLPRFRIETNLHLHVVRTLRPRVGSVKKILQNAVLLLRLQNVRALSNSLQGQCKKYLHE